MYGTWCEQRDAHLLIRKHDAGGLRGALKCSTELPQVLHIQRHLVCALLIACHRVESCDNHHKSVCHSRAASQFGDTVGRKSRCCCRDMPGTVTKQVGLQTGRRELDLDEFAAVGNGCSCGVLC